MTMRSTLLVALCTTSIVTLGACGAHASETEALVDNTPRPIRTAKPTEAELRKELTRVQYLVTQEADTEPPFHNPYWDNHKAGLYVDITTGQPLFTSNEKFDSGTGWPSFFRPIAADAVVEHQDKSFGDVRTEVRSKIGDAHLGHVFDDGPRPTGLRYCINSASLRFIAVDQLEAQGYAQYRAVFANASAANAGAGTTGASSDSARR
jgi:peptide methionine sulfoxide reductase msrA/msrB